MAVTPALVTRSRIIAAKVEATTGTAETLATADTEFFAYDATPSYDIQVHERMGQRSASMLTAVAGASAMGLKFTTDIHGNGTSGLPLWASTLLAACGHKNAAGTFSPFLGTSSYTTLTMAVYVDGRRQAMVGSAGTAMIKLDSGAPGKIEWDFQGVYVAPTDVALLAYTRPAVTPPAFRNATLTVGGVAVKVSNVEIDLGVAVTARQNPNSAFGYLAFQPTNRVIRVRMDPEAALLATQDWFAALQANSEAALSCVIGSDANNIVTIAAPKMQLIEGVEFGDREGIVTDNLVFACNRSSAAGDDELTIAFS